MRHPDDDHLVREILEGQKTASVDLARTYHLPDGDYDDGGLEVGDLVEVYDGRKRLRCTIQITEVYEASFGDIPEKLWRAEVCESAEHFQRAHREVWPDEGLTDETKLIAFHFRLVEIIRK
jgi:uncharacterized protein YhfF